MLKLFIQGVIIYVAENMLDTFHCIECGKEFAATEKRIGKCSGCFLKFTERRMALEKEGYFSNMKRLGSWKINGARGRVKVA